MSHSKDKPKSVSTVVFCEPEYAPGQFVLIRIDLPHTDKHFVWCGRSMGWKPLKTTSNAFFRLFPSMDAAQEAADKYINLPVQTQDQD